MPRKKKDYGFRPFEGTSSKGRHLRITQSMMESTAWKELTCHSITLYLYMKAKFNYDNENDISFTYAEGQQLMTESTFTKTLDQLNDLGFIKVVKGAGQPEPLPFMDSVISGRYMEPISFLLLQDPSGKRRPNDFWLPQK